MIALARTKLADLRNVHRVQNNGADLKVLPELRIDFESLPIPVWASARGQHIRWATEPRK